MASKLSAIFELIDNMSDKLDKIASAGSDMASTFDDAEDAADGAFGAIESGGRRAAQSADGVAKSMDSAADSTGYWTDKVGNYDKSALEFVCSTEELVEMGYKTEDALTAAAAAAEEEADAMEDAAQATDENTEAAQGLGEQSEKTGETGIAAIQGIASALAAAGIIATVKEIAEAAYELADSFSAAEKIVVNATGATGESLEELGESMMDAYAQNDDPLEDTAAAVGEISTRMGLAGEELAEVTQKFMDFADITNGNAATSVKNVTQLMNQWNISAEDLEITMDKLAYAGQASGISVDELSSQLTANKAILDQLGFSLDESIAMFANFELSGTQVASVMTGFRTALSSGAISSLEDLYAIFEQIEAGEMDAAVAADVFGARAGSQIVNAVTQGALSLDGMVSSLENAGGTLESTAEAGESLGEKWEKAGNNIKTAFTTALQPTLDSASAGLAGLANSAGTFLNNHPKVTSAITATGVGLGVVAVGIAGVSAVFLTAIPAVAELGTAISAAIWPLTAVAAGIAAVTAAALMLKGNYDDIYDETISMTAVTAEQAAELEDLQAEYEKACDTYGETSEEASSLRYQIDELSASIEENGKSVEELVLECDALIDEHNQLIDELDSSSQAVKDNELDNLALIARLEELASSTDTTAGAQKEMEAIISGLNSSVDGLNLSYSDLIENQDSTLASIKEMAKAQAEQQKQQEQYDEYVKLLQQEAEEQAKLAEVTDEVTAAQERAGAASKDLQDSWKNASGEYSGWKMFWSWTTDEQASNDAAQDALDEATEKQGELQDALDETQNRIAEIESAWEESGEAAEAASEAPVSYEEAVETAVSSVQDDLDELCAAYDEAYEAARSSLDSQIGLFSTMSSETETSIADMQDALESQVEYLDTYSENLRKAAEYGLDDGLISSLSDGSEESAGYLDEIITNIEQLGANSAEAQQFVTDFNTSFQEVETAKDEFSSTVATMETDFDEKMSEIEGRLTDAVGDMNMSEDAAAAARETMQAYTDAIRTNTAGAVSAAQAAADAVAAALNSSGTTGTSTTVAGHASGTTDAEDVFVAGENGPELIVGGGGSTVFPADETRKIINAVTEEERDTSGVYAPPSACFPEQTSGESTNGSSERKVTLEIAGRGNIQLTGGSADKETMLAFLYEYLKPVLSEILTQEIFEEGDASYEY